MSTTLRPTAIVTGAFVALIGKPYDFTEENGTRRSGTSYKLYVLERDELTGTDLDVHELRVQAAHAGAFGRLTAGQEIEVFCAGFAKSRGGSTVVEWTVERVTDLATGEVVVAPLTRTA